MWHVPVDHENFRNISSAQWMWYFYNFTKDNEQETEINRDLLEYHAWFMEPERVNTIQEHRETSKRNEQSSGSFEDSVEDLFGRKITKGVSASSDMRVEDVSSILDRVNTIEQDRLTRSKEIIPYNYKKWTDFDLE